MSIASESKTSSERWSKETKNWFLVVILSPSRALNIEFDISQKPSENGSLFFSFISRKTFFLGPTKKCNCHAVSQPILDHRTNSESLRHNETVRVNFTEIGCIFVEISRLKEFGNGLAEWPNFGCTVWWNFSIKLNNSCTNELEITSSFQISKEIENRTTTGLTIEIFSLLKN